ncbi:oxidoreductase [Phyllosticta citriasiana]|uniref:Oxidoreductase n=1 Tax=Phyllosticta citriasiana TaxID=595635 RepID=A0ABR1KI26_9PEZI
MSTRQDSIIPPHEVTSDGPGTVIVTGAAGGLGFAIADKLLQRPEPFTCLFTVRSSSAQNAQPLRDLIAEKAGNKYVSLIELDLSSLDSVRAFAIDVNSRVAARELPPIRALILNAAVLTMLGPRKMTYDGFEAAFGVNYLSNCLLTLMLLGSIHKQHGRIVHISSETHYESWPTRIQKHEPQKLPWDFVEMSRPQGTVRSGDEKNDGMRRYGRSKLCLVMFMHALRRRLDANPDLSNIWIVGVNPGTMIHGNLLSKVPSTLLRAVGGPIVQAYNQVMAHIKPNGMWRTTSKSAADVVRAALDLGEKGLGENFKDSYMNGSELAKADETADDPAKQEELWDRSLAFVQLKESETVLTGS